MSSISKAPQERRGRKSNARRLEHQATIRIENDPRFLARVEAARRSLRAGRGVKLEDVEE